MKARLVVSRCASGLLIAIVLLQSIGPAQKLGLETSGVEVKNAILKPMLTVSVAAGVAGIIDKVLVKEGDTVGLAGLLVQIRDDEPKLGLERAKLTLETATIKARRDIDIRLASKSAEVASQELQRALNANSLAPDTYPANEVDRYRLVLDKAKLEIERSTLDQKLAMLGQQQAEVELRQSQQVIDRHTIRAPSQAMVVSVDKHEGEWVESSTKMLELMSIERLRIEGFIDANDASSVEKGRLANVNITVSKSTRGFAGTVVFVSPIANPVNGQVRIFVEIENRDSKVRPGMPVTVAIPNP